MTKPVAVILPVLIAVAAIGSQFSAAVADDSGAGGLLEDITQKKLPVRYAYLLILLVTVTLRQFLGVGMEKLLKLPDAPDVPDAFPCAPMSYARVGGDRGGMSGVMPVWMS